MTGEHLSKQEQEHLPIKFYPCSGGLPGLVFAKSGHVYVIMQGNAPKESKWLGEMSLNTAMKMYPNGIVTQSHTLCSSCSVRVDEAVQKMKKNKFS